jgi:hypothetical protein
MPWRTHDLNMVIHLGFNGIWPTHMEKTTNHHKEFVYGEKPEELVNAYFEPESPVRTILNIYGRVRRQMFDADQYEGDKIPFTQPLR